MMRPRLTGSCPRCGRVICNRDHARTRWIVAGLILLLLAAAILTDKLLEVAL